jgi:uncharacterized protein (TIGR03437 family)
MENLMHKLLHAAALAVLASALPLAALADTTLNLDTGATGSSGGDIVFNPGKNISPLGKATLFDLAPSYPFANLDEPTVSMFSFLASTDPISGSSLAPSEVFTVYTNGGNYGAVLLTAVSSGSVTLQYITWNSSGKKIQGATLTLGGPPGPSITAVQDGASNMPNIAQGSIFIVKGTTLSPSGYTPFAPPRPTSSGGIKVTFTPAAGGTGTDAYLVYLYNLNGTNQIACILPSTVPVGSYNVTVTSGGSVSSAIATQVVASKFALFTQDSTGTGLASVQNYISATQYDLNRLTTGTIYGTTYSPAKPGGYMIAYGTGLGGYANGDNSASPAFDFSKTMTIQAIVGGVSIPVAYAGRAGYAGEDQINFTLPANVQTGCAVTLQISVGGVLSAATTISIAPNSSSTACVIPGYTTAQLQKLDQGGTLSSGGFTIMQSTTMDPTYGTVKSDIISGSFTQLTGFQLASVALQDPFGVIQQGTCQVFQSSYSNSSKSTGTASPVVTLTSLDAGTITVTGPASSSLANQPLAEIDNGYLLASTEGSAYGLPGQVNFTLPGGTYALSGAGGKDVGPFNASLTLPSPLTLSNPLPTTVNRSSPLILNWTGGNASDQVEILGVSSITTGQGNNAITSVGEFVCITTAGQKTFTVPSSVLSQLPATLPNVTGDLEIYSASNSNTFSPTLKADGSAIPSTFGNLIGISSSPAFK